MRAHLICSVPRDSVATETEISADVSRRPRKLKKLFLKICHGRQKLWSDAKLDIGGSLVASRLSFFRRVNGAVFHLYVFFVRSRSLIVSLCLSLSFYVCIYVSFTYFCISIYFNTYAFPSLKKNLSRNLVVLLCFSSLYPLSLVPINFYSFSSPYFLPPFFLCWVWWTL